MSDAHAFPQISGQYLIDGTWLKSKNRRQIINPANHSEIVGEVALVTEQDVHSAITSAHQAFQTWSQSPIEDRVNRMLKAADSMESLIDQNVKLYVRENGKVLAEAKKDLARCLDVMRYAAKELKKWWEPESWSDAPQRVQIRRRPKGVTAVITPWNSPVLLTFKRLVPAILTGNTVVVKPATNCPLTVMTLLQEVAAHFPPGVINIVTGSGSMIGKILSTDPRVQVISFVGGTETGKNIMRSASDTLKKLYMELGGNDPAILLPDVVLDEEALTRLQGGILRAAGQVCSAIKRIYVHESRYDEFVQKLTDQFNRVIVGDGTIPEVNMGPLNNEKQFKFVQNLIEQTKSEGRELIVAGSKHDPERWNQGYFLLPHIVADASPSDPLVHCEQFGPIIPIIKYREVDEAIQYANDSIYGLRASVWTQDREKAMALADRIQAGAVFHNNHTVFQDLHLDFPGLKQSGISRETRWFSFELFADMYGFAN
jgi:acyl-CoA reductase-like NAD-dependent aldehyde dehydrogenase